MRISVFTPTHDPSHLEECYQSLLLQRDTNFEWLVLPNNLQRELPPRVRRCPQLRLMESPGSDRIGQLKRACCLAAEGDILLELDHDDLLLPGAFRQIRQAAEVGDFIYSDVGTFIDKSRKRHLYGSDHGWTRHLINVFGRKLYVTENFPITPRSLCEVYYAPDHLRAWRRATYLQVNGHNPDLSVGDDHDLICRTYLSGARFAKTERCGYLYRFHQENTVKKRQKNIRAQNILNRQKYLKSLVFEWCRRNSFPVGYSLAGSGYGALLLGDVSQLAPTEIEEFFTAAWDALVPGGWLFLTFPAIRLQDKAVQLQPVSPPAVGGSAEVKISARLPLPTCRSYWDETSLKALFPRGTTTLPNSYARFQLVSQHEVPPSPEQPKTDILRLTAALCACKGQRQPGLPY